MLLDIVIIVLRETLEASILIAVLLSIGKIHGISSSWVFIALGLGMCLGVAYGAGLGHVSDWFNYAGQEVLNAGMQFMIYILVAILISIQLSARLYSKVYLYCLMLVIVTIALVREGAEIYVFYVGILVKNSSSLPAITSGFIGLCIGCSAGAIVYYSMLLVHSRKIFLIHGVILTLVAAGMILQAVQLLIQVDWISGGRPLWDTSALIKEESVIGQLAYAIFGYESTPSLPEVVAYAIAIFGLALVAIFFRRCSGVKNQYESGFND